MSGSKRVVNNKKIMATTTPYYKSTLLLTTLFTVIYNSIIQYNKININIRSDSSLIDKKSLDVNILP